MQEGKYRLWVSLFNTVRSFSLGFFMSAVGKMYKIPSPSFSGVLVSLLPARAPQRCQDRAAEPGVGCEVFPEQSLSWWGS